MVAWLRRTAAFASFALVEYVRTGRILVEVVAVMTVVWAIFWPRGTRGLEVHQFFSLGGLFVLALAAYTTSAFMGLGNRPQGYVVLARPLGRGGYLVGLQSAALAVATASYLLLTASVVVLNRLAQQPPTLSLGRWLSGTAPLLLDVAIASLFFTLLSSLVVSSGERLVLLAILAVGLSGDLELLGRLDVGEVLWAFQSLFGFALLPAASGFQLAVDGSHEASALWVMLGQVTIAALLLTLALAAFSRRDLAPP